MTDRMKYWIWLASVPYVAPSKLNELLAVYENPENVWKADAAELRLLPFLSALNVEQLVASKKMDEIDHIAENVYRWRMSVLTKEDEKYPRWVKKIYDPPLVLYCMGNFKPDESMVAIVGSRRATAYGLGMAEEIAGDLARCGITIISGMARGIDSRGHRGALRAGGRTVAVLGCGLDIVYPAENRELFHQIVENGAAWSEYPPGTRPYKHHFPARNRIISGASLGVAVLEADEKSGSLITAEFALDQGREVFALPGNVLSRNSKGTNRLIMEGAHVVTCAEDILDVLGLNRPAWGKKTGPLRELPVRGTELTLEEHTVAAGLGKQVRQLDELAFKMGWEVQRVSSVLLSLELKGVVEQLPGKNFRLFR